MGGGGAGLDPPMITGRPGSRQHGKLTGGSEMTAIVSADDHLDMHTLPPDLWTARMPARYRDHGDRVGYR